MRPWETIFAGFSGILFSYSTLAAPVPAPSAVDESRKSRLVFHDSIDLQDPLLRKRIYFWKKVFSLYGSNIAILHNTDHPWIVYKVIRLPYSLSQVKNSVLAHQWDRKLSAHMARTREILRRILDKTARREKLSNEEKTLARKFQGLGRGALEGALRPGMFRVQRGMRPDFQIALARAQDLLPAMEDELARENVPAELARLPFIESMFNHNAISSVGARGIWQLMPDTARMYGLSVGRFQDERTNHVKATRAAARFLKDYFRSLKSWPLAITAYNQGLGTIRTAVGKMGTRDISTVIRHYRGGAFGFAGQNFFAEFMAALELERYPGQYFGQAESQPKNLSMGD